MIDKLYENIFFISLFLYLLFAIFLFTQKKGNRLSNKIFAGFCLLEVLIIISDLVYTFRDAVYEIFPSYLEVILESSYFLIGPFLFFYTRSLTKKNFRFKGAHLFHLIPFFVDLIFRHYRFFSQADITDIIIRQGYSLYRPELIVRFVLADIHVIVCVAASLIVLNRYRSDLKDTFSSIERVKLSWLYLVLIGFSAVRFFHLSKLTFSFLSDILRDIFGLGMHLGTLVFAAVVVIKGLKQPDIFSDADVRRKGQKYQKTALPQEKMEEYLKKLTNFMKTEKPYLNPSLNIDELASRLSIPSHHISQILNRRLNQNFYHFVNKYRIEESKRIFMDKANHMNVLEVLYETGFNSKSTFNRIFKKHTGMTPTQYINSHPEKSHKK